MRILLKKKNSLKIIFSTYTKMSNPKEIKNQENLEIVTESYEKLIEKLEIKK